MVIPQSRDDLVRAAFRRAQRRRRKLLALLVSAAGLSFVTALAIGGEFWQVHVLTDLSLLSYVLVLLQAKRRREEAEAKVRSISRRTAARFHPSSLRPVRVAGTRR